MPSREALDIVRMMVWYGDKVRDHLDAMEAAGEDQAGIIAAHQTLIVLGDLVEIIAVDDHIDFNPASFMIIAPDEGFGGH